jgi:hypothetical protein
VKLHGDDVTCPVHATAGRVHGRPWSEQMKANGLALTRPARQAYTFYLDADLVEAARREVGERDVVRSIEAALAAAIDYQLWVREVSRGARGPLE